MYIYAYTCNFFCTYIAYSNTYTETHTNDGDSIVSSHIAEPFSLTDQCDIFATNKQGLTHYHVN